MMVGRWIFLAALAVLTAGVVSPFVTTIDTCNLSSPCISGTNSGVGAGVAGISLQGRGVSGQTKHNSTSSSNAMYGVYGVDSSTSGIYNGGVFGTSVRGNGVYGSSSSRYGVYGTTATGVGVRGNGGTGDGVDGISNSGFGVDGISNSGLGVYAQSNSNDGVYGVTTGGGNAGVRGYNGGGYGVYGSTQTSVGVYGSAGNGGTAVYASSDTGYALQAHTSGNVGAYVTNGNGNGADITGSYIGTVTRGPSNGFPLVVTDSVGTNLVWVTGAGDLHYIGTLYNGLKVTGGTVESFTTSSSRPSIEDTGTARLVYGQAIVRLDPTFARTIDTHRPYQVFLTPGGDTRGLYVASKGPAAFVVREVQGGRGTLNFDYHIYATQIGRAQAHMALAQPNAPIIHTVTPARVRPPRIPQRP